ncbi:redoxin domain-containing protein [Brevibacillus sp. HB1.4B]|uniref:TlpA family protein disulfide reductase n=1 Tax=Brevibacillus TaxID=55080 RepID=UPI00156A82A6|nr:redoxin domain-containing protein [Brevibacillus sp. HB1.4B]
MLIQLVIILFFSKLLVDFLNRFRLSGKTIEDTSLIVGDRAPLFREKDQTGNLVKLADNFGKKSVLLFISETCETCKDLIPYLSDITLINPYLKIFVIVSNYSKQKEYNIPDQISLIRSENIVKQYYIRTVPTMIMVDEKGYILYANGVDNFEQLMAVIKAISHKAS